MSRIRPKLNYSDVIATIALFVALGGAAVAAGLPKHSVGAKQLKRGAVTTAALRKQAVTSGKLAPEVGGLRQARPNSVSPGNIGNGAVSTPKIAAGAVIASSIKNGVITTTTRLANANVETTAAKRRNHGSVTPAKLGGRSPHLLGGRSGPGQTLRGVFDVGIDSGSRRPSSTSSASSSRLRRMRRLRHERAEPGRPTATCPGIGRRPATPQATGGNLPHLDYSKSIRRNHARLLPRFDTSATNRLRAPGDSGLPTAPDNVVHGQWAVTAP